VDKNNVIRLCNELLLNKKPMHPLCSGYRGHRIQDGILPLHTDINVQPNNASHEVWIF